MDAGPRFDAYVWAGGREPMLRFGPDDGPMAVLALPLFEEANRTRAFGIAILRALARRGIGGLLPELPGQGESERATVDATLADWRAAFAAAAAGGYPIAIRSGALVVSSPAWLFAPQSGAGLLRELARIRGRPLAGAQVEIAGNLLSAALVDELALASIPGESRSPATLDDAGGARLPSASQLDPGSRQRGRDRVVGLASDAHAADRHVEAAPLWRRAEPGNDPALAELLAVDIADWIAACEG